MKSYIEYNRILLILVVSSITLSILSWTQVPELKDFYANSNGGLGVHSAIEILLSPFLHLNGLHLFGNLLILVFLWQVFTSNISAKNLLPFFLFIEIIQYSVIVGLHQPPTAGISGFVFAIFGYMLVVYIQKKNPEYKGILFFAFISFILSSYQDPETQVRTSTVGHISGFILGILWAMSGILIKRFTKKSGE